jgi:hypothetical protein
MFAIFMEPRAASETQSAAANRRGCRPVRVRTAEVAPHDNVADSVKLAAIRDALDMRRSTGTAAALDRFDELLVAGHWGDGALRLVLDLPLMPKK